MALREDSSDRAWAEGMLNRLFSGRLSLAVTHLKPEDDLRDEKIILLWKHGIAYELVSPILL